ncbi:hypothetical protein AX16_005605 [Volvariella volvacea WC 439]|nr:hypothetical protein AX16_005605 [Volvariella volvacea WC 439]
MSSFKRRVASKQPTAHPGTRTSPSSPTTTIISTGIPSLDDVLGGGLPLSCLQLAIAPDPHTSYGELVQKYFVSQGLVCGQAVHIVDPLASDFVRDIMWIPKGNQDGSNSVPSDPVDRGHETEDNEEDEAAREQDQKIKIAWRYEQMKLFKTTITTSNPSSEDFCQSFDLTSRVPESVIEGALRSGQLSFLEASNAVFSTPEVFSKLSKFVETYAASSTTSSSPRPLRICIPSLGSALWGDITSQELIRFLHSVRVLLRRYPFACASVALPSHISAEAWGGPGWIDKLGWVSDAAIVLSAFSANLALALTFPSHHGFLRILSLPAPHTLLPPSDKFSTLRGLSSSAVSIGGSGENNLAFKCTRKRMIFETLHLDLEGGVGERRTTAPIGAAATAGVDAVDPHSAHDHGSHQAPRAALAAVSVQLDSDGADVATQVSDTVGETKQVEAPSKKPKPKKKVAFHSDRPDLYDF